MRQMNYWKEWREENAEIEIEEKKPQEEFFPAKGEDEEMEKMLLCSKEMRKKRRDWKEEHNKVKFKKIEPEKEEKMVEVPPLEPQGPLQIYKNKREDMPTGDEEDGKVDEDEEMIRKEEERKAEEEDEPSTERKEVSEEIIERIKNKEEVLVEAPNLEPLAPDQIYKHDCDKNEEEKEEEVDLGK